MTNPIHWILTLLNEVNVAIGLHPLAYRMRMCLRTSLHECQQQGAFRSKPLSVLVLWPILWPPTSLFVFSVMPKDTQKSSRAKCAASETAVSLVLEG